MSSSNSVSPSDRTAIIKGAKAHAEKQGTKHGWDIMLSTWDDVRIDQVMGVRTKSVLGAVQMISYYGGLKELDAQRQTEAPAETVEAPAAVPAPVANKAKAAAKKKVAEAG